MSSSGEAALSVRGLAKSYTLAHNARVRTTLADALLQALKTPFGAQTETFWALRDVSFDIRRGDVVGIIGRNGAGKSTLLKVLSRITLPTHGQIDLFGRVGSLLEVGTGFHPELTGRENIFLNGAILGMKRREIARAFDAIVDFSGTGRFLDTPVKRYSSGMYVRLAFAVAAHLNPEILIVDEVLAVGDAEFQKKCLGKMRDVAGSGRTVLFVSHNMTAVQALCNRCLLLRDGQVEWDGDTEEAIARYQRVVQPGGADGGEPGTADLSARQNPFLPGTLILRKASLRDAHDRPTGAIRMGEPLNLVIDVEGLADYREAVIGVKIRSESDQWLVGFNSAMRPWPAPAARVRREQVRLHLPRLMLTPGTYWLDVDADQLEMRKLDGVERALRFEVLEADVYGNGFQVRHGVMFVDGTWEIAPAARPAEEMLAGERH